MGFAVVMFFATCVPVGSTSSSRSAADGVDHCSVAVICPGEETVIGKFCTAVPPAVTVPEKWPDAPIASGTPSPAMHTSTRATAPMKRRDEGVNDRVTSGACSGRRTTLRVPAIPLPEYRFAHTPRPYVNAFTARATTSAITVSESSDCSDIASFAQRAIGITSVGLNAALVFSPSTM